jgi:phosphoribosyl 1,2-cyclic phosphodiesterase
VKKSMTKPFYVKFWGVRGTIPTSDPRMLRYGGNTSCVEVRCGDVVIALDAGTGIIPMVEQGHLCHLHLFLSHTHIDHVMGLCCLRKLFDPKFTMDVWAGHLLPEKLINEALEQLLSPPLFPIALSDFPANLTYHNFSAASGHALRHDDFTLNGITVTTLPLNHPDRATAYRIDYQGHSVCYVTDVEHCRDGLDEAICRFIHGADVFIYDSTYDDDQYAAHEGWGHSTWQQAMRLGERAGVGKVVMFHHDPDSTDEILDARASLLSKNYTQPACIAREGVVIHLNEESAKQSMVAIR